MPARPAAHGWKMTTTGQAASQATWLLTAWSDQFLYLLGHLVLGQVSRVRVTPCRYAR